MTQMRDSTYGGIREAANRDFPEIIAEREEISQVGGEFVVLEESGDLIYHKINELLQRSPHIVRHYVGSREFVACCASSSACEASSSHAKFDSVNEQRLCTVVEEGLCRLFLPLFPIH
jgi:hypothetical protein